MRTKLLTTQNSWGPTLLRFVLSLVVLPHGLQKSVGWFGGYGFGGSMTFFTQNLHLPWIVGFLVVAIETLAPLFLFLGLWTRLWGLALLCLFAGIALHSHIQHGFFMNWFGNQKGEGIEYFLLVMAIAGSLVMTGGGRYAIDARLNREQE